ncbi:MAG: cobalt transporter CbiM [Eubacterium sp.]|nr:cobalt transporter CbiM [Eubacterium sp.]
MHIPENYLSPSTCAVMGAAMIPVWVHAIRKVRKEVPKEKMPLLGVGAAFSFLGMMFNVPLPGGTTGHAVGGTLIAILLGPDAACLAVSVALLIQALLFGDGGILAYGANCFNMAFVLPYVGYAIYTALRGKFKSENGKYAAAAIGSYAGINAAAFCAAVEFGIQPYLFHDAAGQALYCPYGLNISIPSMMIGHLTIFGLAEVIFTVAIFAFVSRTAPGLLPDSEKTAAAAKVTKASRPLYILMLILICAVPIGLLAEGTAWGEWGADEIAEVTSGGTALGYTPSGLANGFELSTIMPDYSVAGLPDAAGYILSAVIGVAIAVILFRLIAAGMKSKTDFKAQNA